MAIVDPDGILPAILDRRDTISREDDDVILPEYPGLEEDGELQGEMPQALHKNERSPLHERPVLRLLLLIAPLVEESESRLCDLDDLPLESDFTGIQAPRIEESGDEIGSDRFREKGDEPLTSSSIHEMVVEYGDFLHRRNPLDILFRDSFDSHEEFIEFLP